MMQTICGISRYWCNTDAWNSLRLICMTKVLQCDAQARGRRVADHRARLERMGHMLLYQAGGGRRRVARQMSRGGLLSDDQSIKTWSF